MLSLIQRLLLDDYDTRIHNYDTHIHSEDTWIHNNGTRSHNDNLSLADMGSPRSLAMKDDKSINLGST